MKIKILQIVTAEIISYAKYTIIYNNQYALRHGYSYEVVHLDNSKSNLNQEPLHPSWGKITEGLRCLNQGGFNYLFILDADAMIVNQNIKLESIILQDPNELIISENGGNGGDLLNLGSLIVENTENVKKIFYKSLTYLLEPEHKHKTNSDFWEQSIINEILTIPKYKKLLSQRTMRNINSHWMDHPDTTQEDLFIWHLMARGTEEKATIFKKYLETHFSYD